jgi:hypothetical protein
LAASPSAAEKPPDAFAFIPSAVDQVPDAWAFCPMAVDQEADAWAACPNALEFVPAALAACPNALEFEPIALEFCPTAVELPPVAVALLGHQKFPAASWLHAAGPACAAPDPNMPGAGIAEIAIVAPSAVPVRSPKRLLREDLDLDISAEMLPTACIFKIGWFPTIGLLAQVAQLNESRVPGSVLRVNSTLAIRRT